MVGLCPIYQGNPSISVQKAAIARQAAPGRGGPWLPHQQLRSELDSDFADFSWRGWLTACGFFYRARFGETHESIPFGALGKVIFDYWEPWIDQPLFIDMGAFPSKCDDPLGVMGRLTSIPSQFINRPCFIFCTPQPEFCK